MRSHPRSAPLYLDGALVAPPACADTSEPRDKIDTAAAMVTMLFAMSSSIWLSRSMCAFLMRGIETTLVHCPCRTVIVEHRTTALARLSSGSRLDLRHVSALHLEHGHAYKIESAESWKPSGIHKWRIHAVDRQVSDGTECAQLPRRHVISARPCSMISEYACHYSKPHRKLESGADVPRPR
jgi:hypothetical protein